MEKGKKKQLLPIVLFLLGWIIGEILMRSSDKKAALKELSGGLDAGGKAKTAAER